MTENNGIRPPRTLRAIAKELDEFYKPPSPHNMDEMARKMTLDLHRIYGEPDEPAPSDEELLEVTWQSFNADFERFIADELNRH